MTHVLTAVHLVLYPLIREELSLSILQIGILSAIPYISQVIVSIPAGLLSDRFGSKNMIGLSLFLALLGGVVASQTVNLYILAAAICLIYVNVTFYHTSSYSFIGQLFDDKSISKAIGIQDIGGNLGVAVGPISAAIFLGIFMNNWRMVYLFWSIPILISALVIMVLRIGLTRKIPQPSVKEIEVSNEKTYTKNIILFVVFLSVNALAYIMVKTFFPLFLVDEMGVSETYTSFVYGFGTFLGIFGAPLGGFLAPRFGEKRWLALTLILTCISIVTLLISFNAIIVISFFIAYMFANTLAMSARSALMAIIFPRRKIGLGYSLYFLPNSIMGIVSPLIGAYIGEVFGLNNIFQVVVVIYVIALLILIYAVKV
jgi:FSR family fosmidomycin resistance protein-like MFS transporter